MTRGQKTFRTLKISKSSLIHPAFITCLKIIHSKESPPERPAAIWKADSFPCIHRNYKFDLWNRRIEYAVP
jgi:hypothetical protein